MPKKKVVIVGNGNRANVVKAIEALRPIVESSAHLVAVDLRQQIDLEEIKADLVLVFGGDGSILEVARRLGLNQIPVAGINLGKFGFLAEFSLEEINEDMEKLLAGNFQTGPRLMLNCRILRARKLRQKGLALNDAVITSSGPSRMLYINLHINGEMVTTFGGDGLIVATPVGSTAHSLSAGGPILVPDMEAFIISPICPHTLANRPLVVPSNSKLLVSVSSPSSGVILTLDGQLFFKINPQDRIEITRARQYFKLVKTERRTFFQTLNEKLHWEKR